MKPGVLKDPGIAFEWSDDNGWLVEEMSKCYERPIANSLSYEIYKRMPNGSDFSEFMLRGVPGINHAFIDGFSYYHHPQDDLDHVSKNSIQHTGENMYLAAKHFTNFDFPDVKKGNASFFNFYGFFINYSSSLDLFLFILALLFAAIAIERLNKDQAVSAKRTLITFLWLLLTLIVCVGLCFGLSSLIKMMYPQYATFYSHHWYNHEWYLITGVGLVLSLCWLIGRKLISKYGAKNITAATILILVILSTVIHSIAPSGTYIIMYPLMAISLGAIAQETLKDKISESTQWIIGGISVALIIGLWTVLSHSLYLAFSLDAMAAAVLPTILLSFVCLGLLPSLWEKSGIVLGLGVALFLTTFVIAHLKAKPTEEFPIKTNLFYAYEGETDKTFAATFDRYIHEGHIGKLDGAEAKRLPRHMQFSRFIKESNVNLSSYLPRILSDSIQSKKVSKTYYNPKRAAMQHLYASEISNIDSLFIDGQLNKAFKDGATGGFYSPMYGIGLDSMTVTLVKRDASVPTKLYINTQYREMPLKEKLPKHVVRNDGLVYISSLEEY